MVQSDILFYTREKELNEPLVQLKKAPQPLTNVWEHDGVHCSAVCVAPASEDWSLRDFYTPDAGRSPIGDRICSALEEHDSPGILYAPTVTAMNAEGIHPHAMRLEIHLRNGLRVMRQQGMPADMVPFHNGLLQQKTRTFLMSGGGCGIGVATGGGHVAMAHLSKDGLIDKGRIAMIDLEKKNPFENVRPTRRFESNVHAFASQFQQWGVDLKQVKIRTVFFVPPKALDYPPDHKDFWESNQKLRADLLRRFGESVINPETGALSLAALTKKLAGKVGFNQDMVSNACYLPAEGQFAHTRNPDKFLATARNLAWVTASLA